MTFKRDIRPPHGTVFGIIVAEANRADLSVIELINITRAGRFAAFRAMRRIHAETGCSPTAIADVWGCGDSIVWKALNKPPEEPAPTSVPVTRPYDAATAERLFWAHGGARAVQIITGKDPRTRADLARWQSL